MEFKFALNKINYLNDQEIIKWESKLLDSLNWLTHESIKFKTERNLFNNHIKSKYNLDYKKLIFKFKLNHFPLYLKSD